jgi:hypothetical protein
MNSYIKLIWILINFINITLLVIDEYKKYNKLDIYFVIITIFLIGFKTIFTIFCDKFDIFGNTILVIYSFWFDNYFKYWICSLSIFICCISINDTIIQIRIHLTENTDQIIPQQHVPIIITNVHISNPIDCCICLDYIVQTNSGKLQKCGHIFHKDCIEQWFIVDPNLRCPMCRDK